MDEKQPASNGKESANQRFESFVDLKTKFDIRQKGFSWYVDTIGQMIDFAKVFEYLESHPDALAFAPQLNALVHAQLAFQEKIKQHEALTPDTISESALAELTQLSQEIAAKQEAFNVHDQNNESGSVWDIFNGMQNAAASEAAKKKELSDEEKEPHNWDGFSEALVEQGVGQQTALDVERLLKQVDRLINLTRRRREQTGLSHKEAKETSENYTVARSEITKIKNRLKKLQSGNPDMNIVTEIAELRAELAGHLKALRSEFPITAKETIEPETSDTPMSEAGSDEPIAHTENTIDSFVQLRRDLRICEERMHALLSADPSYEDSKGYAAYNKIVVSLENYFNTGYTSEFRYDTIYSAVQKLKAYLTRLESGLSPQEEGPKAPLEQAVPSATDDSGPTTENIAPVPLQSAEDAVPTPQQGVESALKKKYEQRLELRKDWKDKKDAYETAYAKYLAGKKTERETASVFQRFAFWKKENMPQELLGAERAYSAARKLYASSLDAALLSRIPGVSRTPDPEQSSPEERIEGLRAALANRFVLKAAHDKLAKEKLYVPEGKSLQVFEDLQRSLHKHRKLIKAAGYATVAGVAMASGGVGAVVVALGAKTLQTKVSAVVTAAGATGGAYLGNRISEEIINHRERKRDDATEAAQMSFSIQNLDSLEKTYLERYRAYEQAVRNKKYIIGAGAIAGGVLGAVVAHDLHDITHLHEAVSSVPADNAPLLPREQLEQQLGSKPISPNIEPHVPVIETPPVHPTEELSVPEHSMQNAPVLPHIEPTMQVPPLPQEPPITEVPPLPQEPLVIPQQEMPITPDNYIEADESSEYGAFANGFTFEPGSKVDTVSEALYETWKQNPDVLDNGLSKKEFLSQMYGAMARIEASPTLNRDILEQMRITSGNLDKVQVGQTIDLQPFFDYLKNNH